MKKQFTVFTKADNKIIPANMFLVKNKFGWLFLSNDGGGQWFVNHTSDWKDCQEKDDGKAIKAIVSAAKINLSVTPNEPKA